MSESSKYQTTVIATEVLFGEGPVWCADDQSVVCTAVASGQLHRIRPYEQRSSVLAQTGGGPNACAPTSDGGFLVTQNGGIDFSLHNLPGFDSLPPFTPTTAGLQHVSSDGVVTLIASRDVRDGALVGPNDLVTMPDGTVYFTDPGHHPLPPQPAGRVLRLDRDGTVHHVAGPFKYCNGIGRDHEGRLLIVEDNGLMYLDPDGHTEWLYEDFGGVAGDGFAVDVDGNAWVCCPADDRIRVVSPKGTIEEVIQFDAHSFPTNCCFGGADHKTMFVTLSAARSVVMLEGLPAAGVPVLEWPGLAS
ncbi:MAG: SMP-30/gluconolactonase/LRE family protein [Acidimicrobiia bacterium]|nr:SMP-30/gluconolactonase/LRE family protein [Acidimicrobiia bacterium]